jgi:hypothetical protein
MEQDVSYSDLKAPRRPNVEEQSSQMFDREPMSQWIAKRG